MAIFLRWAFLFATDRPSVKVTRRITFVFETSSHQLDSSFIDNGFYDVVDIRSVSHLFRSANELKLLPKSLIPPSAVK